MIALCAEHHAKADAGAFTKDQLHALKVNTRQALEISGRFDWMRQRLLTVVGGNFYFDTPIPVQIHDVQVVAFSRDEAGHWLLNVVMPSRSAEPRMVIEENFWLSQGEPDDVECPPHGRLLAAKYSNGDAIRVEFVPDLDVDGLGNRYVDVDTTRWGLPMPITVVEIQMCIAGTGIEFGSRSTRIGGSMMTNCFVGNCAVGLHVGP
jgi:hypothetical protein